MPGLANYKVCQRSGNARIVGSARYSLVKYPLCYCLRICHFLLTVTSWPALAKIRAGRRHQVNRYFAMKNKPGKDFIENRIFWFSNNYFNLRLTMKPDF